MNRLKFLRNTIGKTLKEVSKLTNIDYTTLSRIENGERGMNENHLMILANFFNVSTDYLLGLSDVPNPQVIKETKKIEIPEELKNVQFAFYGEIKELDEDDMDDLLEYARFKKQQKALKESKEKK